MSRNKTSRHKRHDKVTGAASTTAVNDLRPTVAAACEHRDCKRAPGHDGDHGPRP